MMNETVVNTEHSCRNNVNICQISSNSVEKLVKTKFAEFEAVK